MNLEEFRALDPENQMNYLRNILSDMRGFDCVDVHYERDFHAENLTGENHAMFEVCIEVGSKRAKAQDRSLIHALVQAHAEAEKAETAESVERSRRKSAVLARMHTQYSPEDLRLVGVIT